MADHGFHIGVRDALILHHVKPGEYADRQHDIHERPGEGDDQSLPAGLGQNAPRILGVFVGGLLTRHLDVTAQGKDGKSVIGFAAAKAEQARAKSEAERFYLDIEIAGCPKMAQLMDIDHHSDQDQQPQYVFKKN